MKNRFILPIDFSDYSANQIRYAKKWSEMSGGEIILVHHTTPLIPTMTDEKSKAEIRNATNVSAREELLKLAMNTVSDTTKFGYFASEKDIEEMIADVLKEQQYNNIVIIGLRGTNNSLKKLFIGSVALEIIESTENIVVTLPKNSSEFKGNTVFVAVNRDYPINREQLDKLLDTFGNEFPSLHFFSVVKSGEDKSEAAIYLNELLNYYKPKTSVESSVLEGNDVLTEIRELLERHPDKLLVTQKGSRFFIDKLFRRFLINDLMYDSNIPLAILS